MAYAQTPYRPEIPARESTPEERRNITKWMLGFGAFFALTLALIALQLFQATSQDTAHTSLVRVTAALTEIDVLLDHHYDELRARAETAEAGRHAHARGLSDRGRSYRETTCWDVARRTAHHHPRPVGGGTVRGGVRRIARAFGGTSGTGQVLGRWRREDSAGLSDGAESSAHRHCDGRAVRSRTRFVWRTAFACRRMGTARDSRPVVGIGLRGRAGRWALGVRATRRQRVPTMPCSAAFLENTTDLAMIPIRNGIAGLSAGVAIVVIAMAAHALTRGGTRSSEESMAIEVSRV